MKKLIEIDQLDFVMALAGNLDKNFHYIEERLSIDITLVSDGLMVSGEIESVLLGEKLIGNLLTILYKGDHLDFQNIDYNLELISDQIEDAHFNDEVICLTIDGKPVKAKTINQGKYIDMMSKKDLVFATGPAGSGKTYLAVAMAVKALKSGLVDRIIISRPAIEAGENLGFLPGDFQMKVDPYLRPIYDAIDEILGRDVFLKYIERQIIEIAPLAYMRGRTLDKAFIILDEAQNTTIGQMKMFLTRFGYDSKIVINGDVTQVDLNSNKYSGLSHALQVLRGLDEIGVMQFTEKDVVRHALVKKILKLYEQDESVEG